MNEKNRNDICRLNGYLQEKGFETLYESSKRLNVYCPGTDPKIGFTVTDKGQIIENINDKTITESEEYQGWKDEIKKSLDSVSYPLNMEYHTMENSVKVSGIPANMIMYSMIMEKETVSDDKITFYDPDGKECLSFQIHEKPIPEPKYYYEEGSTIGYTEGDLNWLIAYLKTKIDPDRMIYDCAKELVEEDPTNEWAAQLIKDVEHLESEVEKAKQMIEELHKMPDTYRDATVITVTCGEKVKDFKLQEYSAERCSEINWDFYLQNGIGRVDKFLENETLSFGKVEEVRDGVKIMDTGKKNVIDMFRGYLDPKDLMEKSLNKLENQYTKLFVDMTKQKENMDEKDLGHLSDELLKMKNIVSTTRNAVQNMDEKGLDVFVRSEMVKSIDGRLEMKMEAFQKELDEMKQTKGLDEKFEKSVDRLRRDIPKSLNIKDLIIKEVSRGIHDKKIENELSNVRADQLIAMGDKKYSFELESVISANKNPEAVAKAEATIERNDYIAHSLCDGIIAVSRNPQMTAKDTIEKLADICLNAETRYDGNIGKESDTASKEFYEDIVDQMVDKMPNFSSRLQSQTQEQTVSKDMVTMEIKFDEGER